MWSMCAHVHVRPCACARVLAAADCTYLSAQVLGGEEHEGPLSDTWAAAITLCYMVSGETPFHGHS